ncbi:hypothetical protein Pden_4085 [Paracoccus denitrificans PD1222]|uniref:Uncharacterized protein n=1 Tax=Paracoccus denitrificans (strain Pd 1222) TaxID=318586 RepID=A1B9F7_PARDP|nr:hypothetical protein Pden_4085 [Paracoccus denitrificans PD1222]
MGGLRLNPFAHAINPSTLPPLPALHELSIEHDNIIKLCPRCRLNRLPVAHVLSFWSRGWVALVPSASNARAVRHAAERAIVLVAHGVIPLWWGVSRFPIRSRFVPPDISAIGIDSVGLSIRS